MLTQGPLEATDADFSHAKFVEVYNADLANGIGNAFSRVSNMIEKYCEGKCPTPEPTFATIAKHGETGDPLLDACRRVAFVANITRSRSVELISGLRVAEAMIECKRVSDEVDRLIHATEPFKLAKNPDNKARVATILACSAEALRIAATLLSPAMPTKMAEILRRFGQETPDAQGRFSKPLGELCEWGGLKPGTPIVKGEGLFPRIDPAAPPPTP